MAQYFPRLYASVENEKCIEKEIAMLMLLCGVYEYKMYFIQYVESLCCQPKKKETEGTLSENCHEE